jgi:uncharacterized protein YqeY
MIDVEALNEAYLILKQYIPAKDRQGAADNLMSSMVEYLSDSDLKLFGAIDNALSKAYQEYADDADEDYQDDNE